MNSRLHVERPFSCVGESTRRGRQGDVDDSDAVSCHLVFVCFRVIVPMILPFHF